MRLPEVVEESFTANAFGNTSVMRRADEVVPALTKLAKSNVAGTGEAVQEIPLLIIPACRDGVPTATVAWEFKSVTPGMRAVAVICEPGRPFNTVPAAARRPLIVIVTNVELGVGTTQETFKICRAVELLRAGFPAVTVVPV